MKERKLRVYMHGSNTGVGWYRIFSPAKYLKRLGLIDVKTSDWRWCEEDEKLRHPSMEELNEIAHWADLIVFERRDMLQDIATWGAIGELFNMPIVLETDDLVSAVRPYNPGYRGYHPGSEALVWSAKADEIVDAVTVTTQFLHDFHTGKGKPTYILPNSLDVEWRSKFKAKKHKKGEIHMGWLGSAAHYENIKYIEEPVLEILKKHKNVVFHCMSMYGNSVFGTDDPEIEKRIKRHSWSTFRDWPKFLASLGLDIGLAPAMDNKFNRAKSNLRYLEYSMNKTAVIASPVQAYSCIKDGITGLHAMERFEWFEAMDKLIKDENLRKKLGENGYSDVIDNYNMEKNAIMWHNAYKDIVKNFQKEKGHKNFFK